MRVSIKGIYYRLKFTTVSLEHADVVVVVFHT